MNSHVMYLFIYGVFVLDCVFDILIKVITLHNLFTVFVFRKSMSKNNAKGLTTLRQKYRKYAKDYESDIALFRENPDAPDSDVEVERDDQEDESDDGNFMDHSGPAAFGKDIAPSKWVLLLMIKT